MRSLAKPQPEGPLTPHQEQVEAYVKYMHTQLAKIPEENWSEYTIEHTLLVQRSSVRKTATRRVSPPTYGKFKQPQSYFGDIQMQGGAMYNMPSPSPDPMNMRPARTWTAMSGSYPASYSSAGPGFQQMNWRPMDAAMTVPATSPTSSATPSPSSGFRSSAYQQLDTPSPVPVSPSITPTTDPSVTTADTRSTSDVIRFSQELYNQDI